MTKLFIKIITLSALAVTLIACGDSSPKAPAVKPTVAQAPAEPAASPPVTEPKAISRAETLYNQSCIACHATGTAGAPLSHDTEAWALRLEKGMDVLVDNARNGINAMPPKGMCGDCSDDDFKALIELMASAK